MSQLTYAGNIVIRGRPCTGLREEFMFPGITGRPHVRGFDEVIGFIGMDKRNSGFMFHRGKHG